MDCMIDLESMSLHPSNALLLSIGLQTFELGREEPKDLNPLVIYPSLEEQLVLGRHVDPGTQLWWTQTASAEARDDWMKRTHRAPLIDTVVSISNFFKSQPEIDRVWANGILFDIGNLEGLFAQFDRKPPWLYNQVMDMRTIRKMLPVIREMAEDPTYTDHTAGGDVIFQIYDLWCRFPEKFSKGLPGWVADQAHVG